MTSPTHTMQLCTFISINQTSLILQSFGITGIFVLSSRDVTSDPARAHVSAHHDHPRDVLAVLHVCCSNGEVHVCWDAGGRCCRRGGGELGELGESSRFDHQTRAAHEK